MFCNASWTEQSDSRHIFKFKESRIKDLLILKLPLDNKNKEDNFQTGSIFPIHLIKFLNKNI